MRRIGFEELVEAIQARRERVPRSRALLVALSGIDGAGKTTLATRLVAALEALGLRSALVHTDLWHYPPAVRFGPERRPVHFYRWAYRFDDLFASLVEPLRARRSLRATFFLHPLWSDDIHPHACAYDDDDVILLEGLFLLRPDLRPRYDLAAWIDCPFETALERAVARNAEGLGDAELRREYRALYHAAQRIHLERDDPVALADVVVDGIAG